MDFTDLGKRAITGLIGAAGAALIALAGNFFSDGGLIRLLGGVSVSQLTNMSPFEIGGACGVYRPINLGDARKTFCTLTDLSIREGNNKGWNACKLEEGTENGKPILYLVSAMTNGTCTPGAEITCKARCVRF